MAYRWADVVIAPNNSYAKIAISRGRVPEECVHVVRNAPNAAVWHPHVPQRSLREGADFVVCFVGGVARQDGLEELIRAMAWLRENDPSRRFLCLVAGSGDALGDAQQLARSCHVEGSVRFLGWISGQASLRDIVASSDIGVEPCPSNPFTDASTMIKVTEYLAVGRPVVAYDLPEHRVTVGDAGVLVPPELGFQGLGAALLALAKDPNHVAELAEKARRRLDEAGLSESRCQAALLGAYDHARKLGKSRGAPW